MIKIFNRKKQQQQLPKVTVTLEEGIAHMHLTQSVIISSGETKEVVNDEEVKELIADGKLIKV